jgi:hypothetical protein
LSADRLALTGFTSNCLQGAGAADSAASLLTARRTQPSCRRAITIRPVPTLISIGEITGVGAQLGNSEIERACGSWSMRKGF